MSTYIDCRDALATSLGEIAFDVLGGSVRVYKEPPATIQDIPAVVMFGASGEAQYTFGSGFGGAYLTVMPEEIVTERFAIVYSEEKMKDTAAQLWTFRRLTVAKMATTGALGGHGNANLLRWDSPVGMVYGGKELMAQNFYLTFVVKP